MTCASNSILRPISISSIVCCVLVGLREDGTLVTVIRVVPSRITRVLSSSDWSLGDEDVLSLILLGFIPGLRLLRTGLTALSLSDFHTVNLYVFIILR